MAIQGCIIELLKLGTTMGNWSSVILGAEFPTLRIEEESISPPAPVPHEVLVPLYFGVYAHVRMVVTSYRSARLQ